jgi:hypothetical protein
MTSAPRLCVAALTILLCSGATALGKSNVIVDTYNTCDGGDGGAFQKFPDVSYHPTPIPCEKHRVTYRARLKIFGRGSGSGQFAVGQASGRIDRPVRLWVRAITSPHQTANVVWGSDCERTNSDESVTNHGKGGHLVVTSSARRMVRLSVKKPDDCSVTMTAGIQQGTVRVRLVATVRGRMLSDKIVG